MIRTKEAFESYRLDGASEREPFVPEDALLALDHQAKAQAPPPLRCQDDANPSSVIRPIAPGSGRGAAHSVGERNVGSSSS